MAAAAAAVLPGLAVHEAAAAADGAGAADPHVRATGCRNFDS